jgi:hypothetical protein
MAMQSCSLWDVALECSNIDINLQGIDEVFISKHTSKKNLYHIVFPYVVDVPMCIALYDVICALH